MTGKMQVRCEGNTFSAGGGQRNRTLWPGTFRQTSAGNEGCSQMLLGGTAVSEVPCSVSVHS